MTDPQRARLTRWLNTTALAIPYELRTCVLDVVNRQRHSRVKLAFGDFQLDLDLADCLQSNLYLDQVWERDVSNWAAYFAARSDTMADVGAHIGYFTLLMASGNRPAAILAFEPNPGTYRQLQRNVELNGVVAQLNRLAVAEGASEAVFYLPHRFQLGSASLHRAPSRSSRAITVKTVALDDYIRRNQLKRFDLIKMDIEGAEQLALRGRANGLGQHKYGVILFELHRQLLTPDAQQAVVGTLQECGYRLFEVSGNVLKSDMSAQASHLAALCPSALEHFPDAAGDLTLPSDFRAPFPGARI